MHQLLTTVAFRPGQWLLDVGSNTCWASNHFAVRGLQRDRARHRDRRRCRGCTPRTTSSRTAPRTSSACSGRCTTCRSRRGASTTSSAARSCTTTTPTSLRRTFQEAFRVLKPGGKLLVVNETIKTMQRSGRRPHRRRRAVRGLRARLLGAALPLGGDPRRLLDPAARTELPLVLPRPAAAAASRRCATGAPALSTSCSRSPLGRRAYLAWLNHVDGGVPFGMIATKPAAGARSDRGAGDQRFSATCGAVRLNTTKPSTKIADHDRRSAPAARPGGPNSAAALGVAWLMIAWRNCCRTVASGLSM